MISCSIWPVCAQKTQIYKILVPELLFADDAALISRSSEGLGHLLEQFKATCSDLVLVISSKKTVVVHQIGITISPVLVNKKELIITDTFCYLGATIKNYLLLDRDALIWLQKIFSLLQHCTWENKHQIVCTKSCIYECCIINTLLYGCETWPICARHKRMLNTFHKISWSERVTHETVLSHTVCLSLMQSLKISRLDDLATFVECLMASLPTIF